MRLHLRSKAALPTRALAQVAQLGSEPDQSLQRAVERLALSARAVDLRAPPAAHHR